MPKIMLSDCLDDIVVVELEEAGLSISIIGILKQDDAQYILMRDAEEAVRFSNYRVKKIKGTLTTYKAIIILNSLGAR